MEEWKLAAWTQPASPPDSPGIFGWSTQGLATPEGWTRADQIGVHTWPRPVRGTLLAGTPEEVLARLDRMPDEPRSGILIFRRNQGVEMFLRQAGATHPGLQLVGGVAAYLPGASHGLLRPPADVNLLLLDGEAGEITAHNVYDPPLVQLDVLHRQGRTLEKVRVAGGGEWLNPLDFYRSQQDALGVPEEDYESLTLSDGAGCNAHLHPENGTLLSSADLPASGEPLYLRRTSREAVRDRLSRIAAVPGSLVFACAGLSKLLDEAPSVGQVSLISFMYGEIVRPGPTARLGNLMVARFSAPVQSMQ